MWNWLRKLLGREDPPAPVRLNDWTPTAFPSTTYRFPPPPRGGYTPDPPERRRRAVDDEDSTSGLVIGALIADALLDDTPSEVPDIPTHTDSDSGFTSFGGGESGGAGATGSWDDGGASTAASAPDFGDVSGGSSSFDSSSGGGFDTSGGSDFTP